MFKSIERKKEPILTRDKKIMQKMIFESVRFKAEVVRIDEKERGKRRILNLGHTLGHAVEKTVGLKHGEAVSVGLAYAARISRKKKYLSENDEIRILSLLSSLGLPLEVKISGKKIFEAVLKDKKRDAGFIHFVFLHGIGKPNVERISLREMEMMINDLC
jgi:3-dehydroquinate synthase